MQILTLFSLIVTLLLPQAAFGQAEELGDKSTFTVTLLEETPGSTVTLEHKIVLSQDDWQVWREHKSAKTKVMLWQGSVGAFTGGILAAPVFWDSGPIILTGILTGTASALPIALSKRRWTHGQAAAMIGMSQWAGANGALIGEISSRWGDGVYIGAPVGLTLGLIPGHIISRGEPDPNAWSGFNSGMYWGAATALVVLGVTEGFSPRWMPVANGFRPSRSPTLTVLSLVNAGALTGFAAGRAGLLKREDLPWINVGGLVGSALTYLTLSGLGETQTIYLLQHEAVLGAGLGAVGGAVAAHFIGRAYHKKHTKRTKTPQWQRVLRPVPSVSVTPQGDLRANVNLAKGTF